MQIITTNYDQNKLHLGNKMCETRTKKEFDELISYLLSQKEDYVIQATFRGAAFTGHEWVKMIDTRLHSFSYEKKIMKVYFSTFTDWHGTVTIYWDQK